jgi:hypothetical protein
MHSFAKKTSGLAGIIVVLIAGVGYYFYYQSPPFQDSITNNKPITSGGSSSSTSSLSRSILDVTPTDLAQAGYTGNVEQVFREVKYPAVYFKTNEYQVDDVNNVLMVSQYYSESMYTDALFNYGTNRHSVVISGGQGQEGEIGRRVALNFSKGHYYIVIIGPNSKKVEALASLIASKIP